MKKRMIAEIPLEEIKNILEKMTVCKKEVDYDKISEEYGLDRFQLEVIRYNFDKKIITIDDLLRPEIIEILNDKNNWTKAIYYNVKDFGILDVERPYFPKLLDTNRISIHEIHFAYFEKLACNSCKYKIEDTWKMDHFLLWSKNDDYFICFHFDCALIPERKKDFWKIADRFDYRYDRNNNTKYVL